MHKGKDLVTWKVTRKISMVGPYPGTTLIYVVLLPTTIVEKYLIQKRMTMVCPL